MRMRWVGKVGCIERLQMHILLIGKPEGKDHWEDLDVDERLILEWILGK